MDKLLLKLVACFKTLFVKQGIDYQQMMTIVQTKLTMDKRRVNMNWKANQQQKESKNQLLVIFFVYGLMGLFISVGVATLSSLVLAMTILHSYILFMMAMTLITDFSTVLLDTTDNQVILPRPVSGKTLFMARLVHILVYLLQFSIVLSIFPIIATFIRFGIVAGIVILVTSLQTVLMAVFITYLLYLLILRYSSEQKIKEIISFFQIGMTILFTVGFQVLPRIINFTVINEHFELHWYAYLLPPVWMALAIEAFSTLNFDALHIGMVVLAFVVPGFTFWLMNKYLAPSFARKLSALNNSSGSTKIVKASGFAFSDIFSRLVCKDPAEKAGFALTWKITGRDKGFKMQFYPSLAYMVVFIFIIFFNGGNKNFHKIWNELPNTKAYIWLLYMPLLSVSSSIMLINFNEHFAASWVYHSSPLQKPGMLISGAVKALFCKFFVPVFLLLFSIAVFIWGGHVLDDALFAFINNLLCFWAMASLRQHYLPFSRQPNTQQQSGRFVLMLLQLLVIAATVGVHYLLVRFGAVWMLWLLSPLLFIVLALLVRHLQNLHWKKIAV